MILLGLILTALGVLIFVRNTQFLSKRNLSHLLKVEQALKEADCTSHNDNYAQLIEKLQHERDLLLSRKCAPKALDIAICVLVSLVIVCLIARFYGIYIP